MSNETSTWVAQSPPRTLGRFCAGCKTRGAFLALRLRRRLRQLNATVWQVALQVALGNGVQRGARR
eukprot:1868978-Lingulodinium_polyedra.AAC.1